MYRRLLQCRRRFEQELEKPLSPPEARALREELLVQIGFFSHERLVHLLVTLFVALFALLSFFAFLTVGQLSLLGLVGAFLALLVPYLVHYYHLENGVQALYPLCDELSRRSRL